MGAVPTRPAPGLRHLVATFYTAAPRPRIPGQTRAFRIGTVWIFVLVAEYAAIIQPIVEEAARSAPSAKTAE